MASLQIMEELSDCTSVAALGRKRRYRSKSAASNDPRSPYYTRGTSPADCRLSSKSPSVACVPSYDGRRYADTAGLATLRQHYYPEGGWGWVVCAAACVTEAVLGGLQAGLGLMIGRVLERFPGEATRLSAVACMSGCVCTGLLSWPVVSGRSPRLVGALGGGVAALGILFTSFASRFHQLFLSLAAVFGAGAGLARAAASNAVAQYFKRRREKVDIVLVMACGVGTATAPCLLDAAIETLGWRLGLQALTAILAFILISAAAFYRPVSLYHPQRRAILHLKGLQKRAKGAAKEKKPSFFQTSVLKSRTVQILGFGSALAAFGTAAPHIMLIPWSMEAPRLRLQVLLGMGWCAGALCAALLVLFRSAECTIGRQYLAQTSITLLSAVLAAFVVLEEGRAGSLMCGGVAGACLGAHHYALRMFTLEKARARNFNLAWAFVQGAQAMPVLLGTSLAGYLCEWTGDRSGFYFSSICILIGTAGLCLIDLHKWRIQRRKQEVAQALPETPLLLFRELTCISEEAITSCDREEKFLGLSEFENNLLGTCPDCQRPAQWDNQELTSSL